MRCMWSFHAGNTNDLEISDFECLKGLNVGPVHGPDLTALEQDKDANGQICCDLGSQRKIDVEDRGIPYC